MSDVLWGWFVEGDSFKMGDGDLRVLETVTSRDLTLSSSNWSMPSYRSVS